jgi:hypothetical protein
MTATARRTDPATSHEAAAKHERSGRAATNRETVLAAVTRHQGLTAVEYGDLTGLGHVEAQRRLSDLSKRTPTYEPEIAQGPVRIINGHRAMVSWWPVTRREYTQPQLF